MNPQTERESERATLMTVMLTLMSGSLFFFVLFLACGGLWLYVLAVIAGMTIFGYAHYFLWGHALSSQVTADQKCQQLAETGNDEPSEPPESNSWTPEERTWYRRF